MLYPLTGCRTRSSPSRCLLLILASHKKVALGLRSLSDRLLPYDEVSSGRTTANETWSWLHAKQEGGRNGLRRELLLHREQRDHCTRETLAFASLFLFLFPLRNVQAYVIYFSVWPGLLCVGEVCVAISEVSNGRSEWMGAKSHHQMDPTRGVRLETERSVAQTPRRQHLTLRRLRKERKTIKKNGWRRGGM